MDTALVGLILRASQLVLSTSQQNTNKQRLSAIQSSLDQLIFRELGSAFDAISDALESRNAQTKDLRLRYAEESLLRNTGLSPSLQTGEHSNSYLIALAHYGLAFVCALRGDYTIAAAHVLRCYIADPRASRHELTPLVFDQIFKPQCADVFQWRESREREVATHDYTLEELGGKALVVGTVVLLGAFAFAVGGRSAGSGVEAKKNGG